MLQSHFLWSDLSSSDLSLSWSSCKHMKALQWFKKYGHWYLLQSKLWKLNRCSIRIWKQKQAEHTESHVAKRFSAAFQTLIHRWRPWLFSYPLKSLKLDLLSKYIFGVCVRYRENLPSRSKLVLRTKSMPKQTHHLCTSASCTSESRSWAKQLSIVSICVSFHLRNFLDGILPAKQQRSCCLILSLT